MAPGKVAWADHVVWWHVYPLGFVGAEENLDASGAWRTGCRGWRGGSTT